MADISKVRMLNGTEYNYKDAQARRDIDDLKADLGDLDERVEAATHFSKNCQPAKVTQIWF